ncbi:DNA packaging protein UL33 [Felid alphaherpesvirus 1]|uniref:DNA packaging protein UL33 n=1 Tax=Feline herpesvirus 1 TaxID=10334 RepID=D1FXU9_FHV1|nr:DNA packaging protein UL33 [Felid alphaherpesvirus 1]AMN88957.1 DNA packaging protein UL33 [synthetic construct]ACT88325.1 DNA packaging protein UL33 [Felid alphaherpesvirus 1]ALJ84125.1 DNA packaging protein UL33 [Felid alphaherpesvirus 1]ALJ84201.1 DNA packaging protein UL33 [Felid alphaherpesvirus 1]ALJ84277.1 DNA packaging protein UL33 [Felid alphaherpesvirus 1]
MSRPMSQKTVSSNDQTRRLKDRIPSIDLNALNLDSLESIYLNGFDDIDIWFEDLTPPELELFLPTTDLKLNYLSYTQRLASTIIHDLKSSNGCVHGTALATQKSRFSAVINRFLDLHQIIRDV